MSQVFLSYLREDSTQVEQLVRALGRYGIDAWTDRGKIRPGQRWQDAIRQAIQEGNFFLACFSTAYASRIQSYMNEELNLAIAQLRQRPRDRIWFIPVLLNACDVPDWPIGPGETLRDIQWVELYREWDAGIEQIVQVVAPEAISIEARRDYVRALDEAEWDLLIDRIEKDRCLPLLWTGGQRWSQVSRLRLRTRPRDEVGFGRNHIYDLTAVVHELSLDLDAGPAKEEVAKVVAGTAAPDLVDPDELHAVLADLPLSVYITTAFDTHMEAALRRRERTPFQQTWSITGQRWESVAVRGAPEPSPNTPWVVHLRGVVDRPESLILTDVDHVRFFGGILHQPTLLGPEIGRALAVRSHMYLGHRSDDRITQLMLESFGHSRAASRACCPSPRDRPVRILREGEPGASRSVRQRASVSLAGTRCVRGIAVKGTLRPLRRLGGARGRSWSLSVAL